MHCEINKSEMNGFLMKKLVSSTGDLTKWGVAILEAYMRVAKYSIIPQVKFTKKNKYLIIGARNFNALSPSLRNQAHVVLTARDPFRLSCIPKSFSYDLKSYSDIINSLSGKDKRLDKLSQRIVSILIATSPRLLVANSTVDPINRLWIRLARETGINTMCVQHGVYSTITTADYLEDDIIDAYVALDSNQSKIVEKVIPNEKITVLGKAAFHNWIAQSRSQNICFVGEDWERYGYHNIKHEIVNVYKKIIFELKSKGINKLFYKTHPSEIDSLDMFDFTSRLSDKNIAFVDVYIGFSSTLLKEMSSKGKLCIQILDRKTFAINFEESGYCLSIHNDMNAPKVIFNILSSDCVVPHIESVALDEILLNYKSTDGI